MNDVFISSTLQTEWNKRFNYKLSKKFEENSITCFLPQSEIKEDSSDFNIYNLNIEGITNARIVLSVGINESINLGIETGFAFGKGKKIILLTEKNHLIPVMSIGMYHTIIRVHDLAKIDEYLENLIKTIKTLVLEQVMTH